MKKTAILLALLMMVPAVLASVEVTYTFGYDGTQVDDVKALAYQCQNQDCSAVSAFQGKVNGQDLAPGVFAEATNGEITVLYPHYAPPEGYALFFVSQGYLPKEVWSDWSTGGFPTAAPPHSEIVEFNKAQSCSAPISSLSFENEVDANSPLVVNADAALDAGTESAFSLTAGEIEYVPAQISQEYYSVDTNVMMEILDSTDAAIYTDMQEFKNDTNNALFAGSTIPISFTYVPTENGTYTVRLTTTVTDDQCETMDNETAQGGFSVLDPNADEYCYTLIDDLTVDNAKPEVGEQVAVTFSKYSGYKIGTVQQEIEADVTYDVELAGNSVGSFPDTIELLDGENTGSFTFTPTAEGTYTITVEGVATNALCNGLDNFPSEQTLTVTTQAAQTYTVKIILLDAENSEPVEDADVTFASELRKTDGTGTAEFTVPEGNHDYTIEAAGYPKTEGDLDVYSHVTEYMALQKGNLAPVMRIPGIEMVYGTDHEFDLDDYVTDDHDATLDYSASYDSKYFEVTISGSDVGIEAKKSGFTKTITFAAEDSQGEKSTQDVTVKVRSLAPATEDPELDDLPDVQIAEDNFDDRMLDLFEYADDPDTSDEDLTFAVESVSSNDVKVSIQQDRYLGVYPTRDFTGTVDATISVTDGQATAQDTLQITVTPVNDAPRVIARDFTLSLNGTGQLLLDMADVFDDVDDALADLTYTITDMDNVTITPQTLAFLIERDYVFSGSRAFELTAEDPAGENATAQFTLLVGATGDAPYIIGPIDDDDQIEVFEDLSFTVDLTRYEDDLEDGPAGNNNDLTWDVSDINASLFSMWVEDSTDKLYIDTVADMNGQDDIVLTLTDSDAYTDTRTVTVVIVPRNDAPAIQSIPSQAASLNTLFTYQVNASDVDLDALTYYDNTTLFDIDANTGLINSTVGTEGVYSIEIMVCDDSGATNNCTIEIMDLTVSDLDAPTISNIVEPADPSYFGSLADVYQFSADVTDNKQVDEVWLEFGGTVYRNGTVTGNTYTWEFTNLTPGAYEYRFYANDTEGHIAASNATDWTLMDSNGTITLTLNAVRGNITVPQNTLVSAIATLLSPGSGNVTVYVDGTPESTNASPLTYNFTPTTIGMHEVMAFFAGAVGYDAANETWFVNVTDGIAPAFPGTYASINTVFQPNYTFSRDMTDNVGVEEARFEFDGTNYTANMTAGDPTNGTWTTTVGPFTPGTYSIRWHARDAMGNWNSTALDNFTILPGSSNLNLLVNGVSDNTTGEAMTDVPLFASVSNPVNGTVQIWINNAMAYAGQGSIDVNRTFNMLGDYNITAVFPGTTNVSAENLTYVITIVDTTDPELTNITEPADPSYYVSPTEIYQFSIDATDFDLDTVRLNFNGTYYDPATVTGSTYTFNVTGLTSDTYNYSFEANDTSGNSIATTLQTWTLEKQQSNLTLMLNGLQSDLIVLQGTTVVLNATMIEPANGNVSLHGGTLKSYLTSGIGNVVTNFTPMAAAKHLITARFAGDQNYAPIEVMYNITSLDAYPPEFSDFTGHGSYLYAPNYTFTTRVTDNMAVDDVWFRINGTDYPATRTSGDEINGTYSVTVGPLAIGNYTIVWFANDTRGNQDDSDEAMTTPEQQFSVIPDTISPVFGAENVSPANNSLLAPDYVFQIDVTDNVAVDIVILELNGPLMSNNLPAYNVGGNTWQANVTGYNFVEGQYIYSWTALDAATNANTTVPKNYVIAPDTDAPVFGTETMTPANNSLVASAYEFSIDATDNVGVTAVNLTFGGVTYAAINSGNTWTVQINQTLADGTYNYQWQAWDAASNLNATPLRTYVVLPDTTAPGIAWTSAPASPHGYRNRFDFQVQVTDDVAVDTVTMDYVQVGVGPGIGQVLSRSSGTAQDGLYYATFGPLAVGNYTFTTTANDTSGNVHTSNHSVEVIQGTPEFLLELNGVQSDTTVPVNDTLTLVADLITPDYGSFNVSLDGNQIYVGTTSYTDNYAWNTTGIHTFLIEWAGDANVSAGNLSRNVVVIPPVTKNVTPASGTHLNASSVAVTVTTSAATMCAWDATDVDQQAMANAFTTTNGLTHTATIDGLVLGNNNVYISCNNESAASNSDVVYIVDNIFSGSTFTGANTIHNSTVINSTVEDSEIDDSTIERSELVRVDLDSCTVLDSVLTDVTASNCFIDPSVLTGTTLSNSRVINGTVTYSTLTNTNITGGEINNTVLTGSEVSNTNIVDSNLTNAVVVDYIMTSGSITYNGTTSTATNASPIDLRTVVQYAPQAAYTQSKNNIKQKQTVDFDATASSDLNNDALTYVWDFGDGSNGTGATTSHKYTAKGLFTVTLTVTDATGRTDTATSTVSVARLTTTSSGGGGGGGGSGYRTYSVPSSGTTQYYVRSGTTLMLVVDGQTAATPINVRKVNIITTKYVELLHAGDIHRLNVGDVISLDVTKDGEKDVDMMVKAIDRGEATFLVGKKGSLRTPVSQITSQTTQAIETEQTPEPKQEEKTPTTTVVKKAEPKQEEITVPVEAEVGESFWSKTATKIKNMIGADLGGATPWIVLIVIVGLGLVGYFVYTRYAD